VGCSAKIYIYIYIYYKNGSLTTNMLFEVHVTVHR